MAGAGTYRNFRQTRNQLRWNPQHFCRPNTTRGFLTFPEQSSQIGFAPLGVHNLALEQLKGCNLIFVDPDNGLIVPSAVGTLKSNKFALPLELADYYRSGSSVIYYQHKARRPDSFYVTQHNRLLHSGAFPDAIGFGLKFKTTSQRYYFFLVQPCHVSTISACVQRMVSCEWSRHFSLMSCL